MVGVRAKRYARRRKNRLAKKTHDLTESQWQALVAAWGGCAYCGRTDGALQKDCMLPIANGGRYTLTNVVPACPSCNASKCSTEVTTWLRRKRMDEPAFLARQLEILRRLQSRCQTEPVVSPQTLSETERRTLARWAAACAEHVITVFTTDDADADRVIRDALTRAAAFARGESTAAAEIRRRMEAVKVANSAATPAGAAAARSVAQAAAVAHVGAHALGAAAYAVKAVSLAQPDHPDAVSEEVAWQLAQLADAERDALRRLPLLGTDTNGPLGSGLLTKGVLGEAVRAIQDAVGSLGH